MQKLNWKPKSEIEKAGLNIVRLLNSQNYQAFFVGGFVRDLLTKNTSDNIDIATDALPDAVEEILEAEKIHFKQVGKKFGTILAIVNGQQIEITTFRKESRYSDQRHPDQVVFIREYLDDAQRRDLTINAMYFNPLTKELFDPTGGIKDLKAGIVRFVGDPKKRIDEDPLRMLRAVRFATVLDFKLEKNSFAAIKTRAKLIQGISGERIKHEFDKILVSENRSLGLDLATNLGLMRFVLPELVELKKIFHSSKKFHLEGSVFNHTLKVVEILPPDLELLYAGLFHDIGKVSTKKQALHLGEMVNRFFGHQQVSKKIFDKFAQKYRFSRQSRELVGWLILRHDDRLTYRQMREDTRIKYSLHPLFSKLLEVWKADAGGNLRLAEKGEKEWGNSDSVKLGYEMLKKINSKKNIIQKFSAGDFIIRETKLAPGIKIGQLSEKIKTKIVLEEIKNESDAKNFLKKFAKNT